MMLTPVDYVLGGVAVLLVGIGLFRGFSGELGSLAGFSASVAAGFFLLGTAHTCAAAMGFTEFAAPAAYVIDFVFAILAFGLVRFLTAKFVSVLVPQPTNALLGALGGLAKSVLIAGVLTGIGFMPAGQHGTGFFATRSVVIGTLARWVDACGVGAAW